MSVGEVEDAGKRRINRLIEPRQVNIRNSLVTWGKLKGQPHESFGNWHTDRTADVRLMCFQKGARILLSPFMLHPAKNQAAFCSRPENLNETKL